MITATSGGTKPNNGIAATTAIAQASGSGRSFLAPEQSVYAFSTVLPDKADAATLIGDASTVAAAFLGPRATVIGTAILGLNYVAFDFTFSESSTFEFSYRGDLLLGVIHGGTADFSITINGVQIFDGGAPDDTVIDLGSNFGPNIDLKIAMVGSAELILGGALLQPVPEPSTWAMMLVGFAGLGFAGYRSTRGRADVWA